MTKQAERVFLQYPDDWDKLSEEERMAAATGMAIELQRQLGIVPTDTETSQSLDNPDHEGVPDLP